nr:probable LRR receptor-like serine/threonine-protein kinase At3g47570 [Ipomoea batatas]
MTYEAEVCSRRPCITPPLLTLPCSCHRRRQGRDEFKPAHTLFRRRYCVLEIAKKRVGTLPISLGYWLPNLKGLYLCKTYIGGVIPPQISNASNLAHIELCENQFTGFIPNSLGNLAKLKYLNLVMNNLTTDPQFSLMTSLANCRYIKKLQLAYNPLNAVLPNAIGNLSNTLQYLHLGNCNIKGRIPEEIGNLSNLYLLILWSNDIIGFLPATIKALQNLQLFGIQENKLVGSFPDMHVPPCPANTLHQSNKDRVVLIVLVSLAVLIVLIASVSVLCIFKRHSRDVPDEPNFLLTGEIPSGGPFANFTYESFLSNDGLCGTPRMHVQPCPANPLHTSKKNRVVLIVLVSLAVLVVLVAYATVSTYLIFKKRKGDWGSFPVNLTCCRQ